MGVPLRALVIDDSGIMRKMVMKGLVEANLGDFEFVEAVDGKDALEKFQANDIHIAFIDWNMPNMTGIEFVREVRALEKRQEITPIPLVMITSEKTMGKIEEALDEAGANGFVSKPFTSEYLAQKLKKVVDSAHLVQSRRQRLQGGAAGGQPAEAEAGGFFKKLFS